MNKKIIGCDIGGVLRDTRTGEPIVGSIESIKTLSKECEIIFISKAKDAHRIEINKWLATYGLSNFKIIFCETYEEKASIAKAQKINFMIDDKITVLSNMKNLNNINKIWFCDDDQKINGTKKFNLDVFTYMKLTRTWEDIVEYISSTKIV